MVGTETVAYQFYPCTPKVAASVSRQLVFDSVSTLLDFKGENWRTKQNLHIITARRNFQFVSIAAILILDQNTKHKPFYPVWILGGRPLDARQEPREFEVQGSHLD